MAIVGIGINKKNPEYTQQDFIFWMPQFRNYINTAEGQTMFENLYPIANNKIFYSIFGTDWKLAMSLCIAHYAYLIGQRMVGTPGDTLDQVYGGGIPKGLMTSASVGGFNKTYDLTYTTFNSEEALFWNKSSYGMDLMALYKTKAVPSIFVVTSGSVVPDGNPSFNQAFGQKPKFDDLLVPFNVNHRGNGGGGNNG